MLQAQTTLSENVSVLPALIDSRVSFIGHATPSSPDFHFNYCHIPATSAQSMEVPLVLEP